MPEEKVIPGKLIHWRMVLQSWVHSRKAVLLLAVFAVGSIALFTRHITGEQWIDLIKWAVPIYMAANVADNLTDKLKG